MFDVLRCVVSASLWCQMTPRHKAEEQSMARRFVLKVKVDNGFVLEL
jgi:hypothetical protein